MRREPIRSGLLKKHVQLGLNERGAANAPTEAPGDSWPCHLFSFYITQHCEHPARTRLPESEGDGESRRAGQGEAGCWQHLCGSSMVGTLTSAPCWRCAPIAVPCCTHREYPHSLHGARGLPVNVGQPHGCPRVSHLGKGKLLSGAGKKKREKPQRVKHPSILEALFAGVSLGFISVTISHLLLNQSCWGNGVKLREIRGRNGSDVYINICLYYIEYCS